jgi:hypothetical protein
MRSLLTAIAVAALAGLIVATPAPADAQAKKKVRVAGTYDVTYEDLANNCTQVNFTMAKGSLTIKKKKATDRITVRIPQMPTMKGKTNDGTFRAKVKRGDTSIEGVQGKFSATGKVVDGQLEMVLMAELYMDRKPLCTQSWTVKGSRK